MGEEAVSLRDAVFWLNVHLDLLAANQRALRRMRDLVAVSPRGEWDYEPDFRLLSAEARRLLGRIVYWEHAVDLADRPARIRPILTGFGFSRYWGLDRRQHAPRRRQQERRGDSALAGPALGRTPATDRRQQDRRRGL
jgi:hypothetical protein